MLKFTVVVLLLVTLSQGLPVQNTRSRADIDLMLDDMRFGPEGNKSGIVGDRYRWPNRQLVYYIDPNFSSSERNTITQAFSAISSRTCITFREWNNDNNYVYILKGDNNSGCWSYVGMQGGQQTLNLQPSFGGGHCIWTGTVAHELIHAIGYYHEQSRPDRDDWVTINWGNIAQANQYNFDKYSFGEVDTFNTPYDYTSIMHYGAYDFAINGNEPTIIPRQSGAQLGGDQLTSYDAQKINNMYKC